MIRGAEQGWRDIPVKWFRFLRRWPVVPVFVLGVLVIAAVFAPQMAPHDPIKQSLLDRNGPPFWAEGGSSKYILGNDHVGRDLLSRIIFGARISMMVVGISLASGMLVGISLGLISGWFGGILDEVIARTVDIWLALPFLLVALVVVVVVGQSLTVMIAVLAMVAWVPFVRNVRAEVLSLKERDYVALAKVSGASVPRILAVHIMPNVLNTIVVIATLNVGGLILTEATLSFLGAGHSLTHSGLGADGRRGPGLPHHRLVGIRFPWHCDLPHRYVAQLPGRLDPGPAGPSIAPDLDRENIAGGKRDGLR